MDSGKRLFVIRTALASVDEEVRSWREERVGTRVRADATITEWPLGDGGRQTTLDVTMEDGFRFEADLIEAPERDEDAELETEWVFEGTPGVEMGRREP